MVSPLPTNFTIIEAQEDRKTIRELAKGQNVAYLTPYYLVQRKENVSATKDVIAVTDTSFYRGTEARTFLNMATDKATSIQPSQIADGAQVFVQSSSHDRQIPLGSKILLQVSTVGSGATSGGAAAASGSPARAPAGAPPAAARPLKRARRVGEAEEEKVDDSDDDDALGSNVLRLRLGRESARSSYALQASLIWNDIADLDLSCITPGGTTINYANKESECGGWLDVDMNTGVSSASTEPIENIFWASAPSGKYIFRVTNFCCHTDPERTVFVDAGRSVPYRVFLTKDGERQVFDGSVKHKEMETCFEFELEGEGALGSFVVMPPSDTKTTFEQACETHGVTYSQGNGYYAVAREEDISANKAMLLQDIAKDTFVIGATDVRTKLGWALNTKIKKGPKDIPEGFRLFVQSTSHNRLIPPGTHTLMKVSVKEALQHRPAHNTQFKQERHTMGTSTGLNDVNVG